MNSKQLVGDN